MKIAFLLFGLVAAIAVIAIVLKLIAGAATIITGALNTVIALAVIIALIVIVVWMFSFATRRQGK